jgi:hypothetical protein
LKTDTYENLLKASVRNFLTKRYQQQGAKDKVVFFRSRRFLDIHFLITHGRRTMKVSQMEVAVVEAAVSEAGEARIAELNELQLALVGGGFGETIL